MQAKWEEMEKTWTTGFDFYNVSNEISKARPKETGVIVIGKQNG